MKQINVLTFGAITEITGNKNFVIEAVDTTEALVKMLEEKYPVLKTVQYAIAVNKEVIQESVVLNNHAYVALLPPFSGG
jgi:molybdopterin converting factor small subunit